MAPFEVGLVTVRGEYVGVGQVAVVGDQWKAAVAGGVVGDVVQVDVGGKSEPVGGDLPVARFWSGPAASCLLVRFGGGLCGGGGDPPVGVSLRQCGGRGLFDRDPGFVSGTRAGELGIECFDRGHAGFDAVAAGGGVAGGFGGGVDPGDSVPLGRGQWGRGGGVDLFGLAGTPAAAGCLGPVRGVGLEPVPEGGVLGAGTG